ncbi:MAG TPA: DUF3598 family protein [Rhizomicrobium sp.]|nr:DUF3598 family protein [Rhizomicrobium sp.]
MDGTLRLADFAVLPRLTGAWQGQFICLDADAREIRRFHALLTQEIVDGRWVQRNENTYPDGSSEVWHFFGRPVAKGRMQLTSPDAPYSGFRMLVREAAENVVLLQVWDVKTNAVLATETFTLIDRDSRVRTIQQFAPDGALRGVMVVKERRASADQPPRKRSRNRLNDSTIRRVSSS